MDSTSNVEKSSLLMIFNCGPGCGVTMVRVCKEEVVLP